MYGPMDEVVLWDRALTADEVSLIYQAGSQGKEVTTVVVPKPAAAATVSVARTATGLSVTYTGTLQASDTVNGTYSDVSGAASPFAITPTGTAKFYRARQ